MHKLFTLTWNVTDSFSGSLLRDFLKRQHISRAALTDIKFKGGCIEVNGEKVNVRYKLTTGDFVKVTFPPEYPSESLKPTCLPLDVIYEDDYLLVINKSAGMPSIPTREHLNDSLSNALLLYYEQNSIASTIHLVNRLDRDTSGLLIVAKYRHVHFLFSQAQEQRAIKRTYRALVHGTLSKKEGIINAPIGRKNDSIIERVVRSDGQYAVTHYKVIEEYDGFSEVDLQLDTGRTHQIRVHMEYLGNPLLGDSLYGGSRERISRQALHSYKLTFFHPILQREVSFQSPLPDDMQRLVQQSRG
ncbi:RluA family pseudouridine synthase [Priestia flexa]|uniref:RluA family pseudouridine synthase n=1 Tax=Priestia flexa TaxID=86664 RepID=UPI001B31A78C|nr:RluA family pseudouridine synthase [Priestia flexa]